MVIRQQVIPDTMGQEVMGRAQQQPDDGTLPHIISLQE